MYDNKHEHGLKLQINNAILESNFYRKVIRQVFNANGIAISDILADSGANCKIVKDQALLSDALPSMDAVTGVGAEDKYTLSVVGTYGNLPGVYASKNIRKSIIPPQSFLEQLPDTILIHVMIQQNPPIHCQIGVKNGRFDGVYAVAFSKSENIFV